MNKPLILASSSPRRRELLAQLGLSFEVAIPEIDETPQPDESPLSYVERMAREKASAILEQRGDVPGLVIGSDTSVVLGAQILGKPRDRDDFGCMMRRLSGADHEVITAVAIVDSKRILVKTSVSQVYFRELSEKEVDAYWITGEPADKAGGYAIQGQAALFVRELRGSFSGVMGLPLYETGELLRQFGVDCLAPGERE